MMTDDRYPLVCFVENDRIRLIQTGPDAFTVVYGKHVRDGLTYGDAAHELGECIMHHAAGKNRLINEEV